MAEIEPAFTIGEVRHTADPASIVCAFIGSAAGADLKVTDLPNLIATVFGAVDGAHRGLNDIPPAAAPAEPQAPAVSIKKSVTPDYLICLDDGQRYKSLKRHLSTLGMTPDEYRTKWGLPRDYPMVAPNYAAQRSALAKAAGLGTKARGGKKPVSRKR